MRLGVYKHYKGNMYLVVSIARHTETMEEMVVYRDLKNHHLKNHQYWVRPLLMFLENVQVDDCFIPRFKKIELSELSDQMVNELDTKKENHE